MLNFALCDDNESILARLSKMLESLFIKYNFDCKVSFTSVDPNSFLAYVINNPVDVIFLDIDLKSNINGLSLAETIRKYNKNIYIIFTTAHLEYGLMAYRYKTFDYLPKPVSVERLEVTISRLLEDIADTPCKYLKLANSNTFLTYDSIYFIKKDGMKLIFQTHEKIYSSYDSFANILPSLPTNFVRCHKSYIVNINNIQNIVNDRIMFCNNLVCYIGPKYKNTFEEVLSHGNIPNNLDSTNYAKWNFNKNNVNTACFFRGICIYVVFYYCFKYPD